MATEPTSRAGAGTAPGDGICAKYYGGKDNVRVHLCNALKAVRINLDLKEDDVDIYCGNDGQQERPSNLPKCADYEKNPSLMTGKAFSIVSQVLMVDLDDVALKPKVSPEELQALSAQLHKQGAAVIAATGGRQEVNAIKYDVQVPMLLLLAALHELDEA